MDRDQDIEHWIEGRSLPRLRVSHARDVVAYSNNHDVAILALRGMKAAECAMCVDVQLVPDEQVVLDNRSLISLLHSWPDFRERCNRLAATFLKSLPPSKSDLQITFDFYTEEDWTTAREE